ncbi:hypothetical protein OH944_004805, partial [Vibrio parahaemolyticus]|nr:hypothetical protein [Vibrio parahaemolyticus]
RGTFASSLNQFSIVFEGEKAQRKAGAFLYWARGARGWSMKCTAERKGNDLALIRDDASEIYAEQFERFQLRQANWKSQLAQVQPPEPDINIIKSNDMAIYHDYCHSVH